MTSRLGWGVREEKNVGRWSVETGKKSVLLIEKGPKKYEMKKDEFGRREDWNDENTTLWWRRNAIGSIVVTSCTKTENKRRYCRQDVRPKFRTAWVIIEYMHNDSHFLFLFWTHACFWLAAWRNLRADKGLSTSKMNYYCIFTTIFNTLSTSADFCISSAYRLWVGVGPARMYTLRRNEPGSYFYCETYPRLGQE